MHVQDPIASDARLDPIWSESGFSSAHDEDLNAGDPPLQCNFSTNTHGRTRTHRRIGRRSRLVVSLIISQGWFRHTEVLAAACYLTFPPLIARWKIHSIDRSIKLCAFVTTCPNSGTIWGKLSQRNLKLNSKTKQNKCVTIQKYRKHYKYFN